MTTRFSDVVAYFVVVAVCLRIAVEYWNGEELFLAGLYGFCAVAWVVGMYEKTSTLFSASPDQIKGE